MKEMTEMTETSNESIEMPLVNAVRKNARRTKSLRNARARKKLEALRDEMELRRWLADVWSDPDAISLNEYHDPADSVVRESLAA